MDQKKLAQLNQFIESADLALQQARDLLQQLGANKAGTELAKNSANKLTSSPSSGNEKIIEGIFDGQNMISADGKEFTVPNNYASKSKLVAGDVLKLTIQPDGSFLYKQIKPIERDRLSGTLAIDEITGEHSVLATNGKKYHVLTASVTYFKGEPGDQVTVIIPKNKTSSWAAIENVLKNNEDSEAISVFSNAAEKDSQKEKALKEFSLEKLKSEAEAEDVPEDISEDVSPKTPPEEHHGLTQHAASEPIFPETNNKEESSPDKESRESAAEKEKIEKMINSPDLGDLDDLKKEDLADL